MKFNEAAFENFIADWLVAHGGYQAAKNDREPAQPRDFDPMLGLDRPELFTFIKATQAEAWQELIRRRGGDPSRTQWEFLARLVHEIDGRGTVDVLRHGVVDQGITIRLAYFRPAHGLTPELVRRYAANRLTVTRQLRYDAGSDKAIDLVLFVNGIPVATAELKNQLTDQDVEHAIAQYRRDRSPRNVTLGQRAVVHFGVDTQSVAMTTRLEGSTTRFLPFNRGWGRAAGNPPNPNGHASSYLWERVWQRDAWLDLLAKRMSRSSTRNPGCGWVLMK